MPGVMRRAMGAVMAVVSLMVGGHLAAASAGATPEASLSALVASFNRQAADETAALFAADAEFMLPDAPPAKGRAAIAATLTDQFRTTRLIDLVSITVTRSGRQAVAAGRLTLTTRTAQHGADVRAGSYLAVLQQAPGGWTISHLMFTLPLRPDFMG